MIRILVILIALFVGSLLAAELESVEIKYDGGRYKLVSESQLAAPIKAVFDVLIDYDKFNQISSVYRESGYTDPAPDGTPQVYTHIRGCILSFCKSIRRLERLEISPPFYIRATVLPEHSDFNFSVSQWDLESKDGGTYVTYSLEMEPAFWVPPVIGPWAIQRRLERDAQPALDRIERIAQENITIRTAN